MKFMVLSIEKINQIYINLIDKNLENTSINRILHFREERLSINKNNKNINSIVCPFCNSLVDILQDVLGMGMVYKLECIKCKSFTEYKDYNNILSAHWYKRNKKMR